MIYQLSEQAIDYINISNQEALELLLDLAKIPAPSHHEDKRAIFCKQWLEKNGAKDVFIDEAKNVVYPVNCEDAEEIVIFMAHTDVVFEDKEELPVEIKDNRVYAPGIGDNTGNLVNLLMCAKYVTRNNLTPKTGILFVMNSCEEGLGNMKGSKKIVETYKNCIREFYSFDGYLGQCTYKSVGSQRYRVNIKTEGGHSYEDFGNESAIWYLSSMIQDLYAIQPPLEAKTTFNIGKINGGTSVNTIAEDAFMLYEFRSVNQNCLRKMENLFYSVIDSYQKMDIDIEVEIIGIRPCNRDINEELLKKFTEKNKDIIQYYYDGELDLDAHSTDSNIPLSTGIPANTIGTVIGAQAHTRDEWLEIKTLEVGLKVALTMVLTYFKHC